MPASRAHKQEKQKAKPQKKLKVIAEKGKVKDPKAFARYAIPAKKG